MSTRRPIIEPRKPIFIGCEGESEQGYAVFLQDLAREAGLHVHLNIEVLKAGDPLSRIELAVSRLARLRTSRVHFPDRHIFLDTDQLALDADRANRARQLAAANDIKIIWQKPCFEAMLLRHFAGRATHRPPTNNATEAALLQVWPDYQKPPTRNDISKKLALEAVKRAAAVEPDLMELLRCIGLMPPAEE